MSTAQNPVAAKLTRRSRQAPEPDEIAIVLTGDLGGSIDVLVSKTNVRTPAGVVSKANKIGNANSFGKMMGKLHDGRDRLAGYAEYRKIDRNIPEGGAALDIIASSAAGGEPGNEIIGFDLEYASEFPEVDQMFVDRLMERLALKRRTKPLIRDSNRMGDVFFHVIVDNLGYILALRFLEPQLTFIVVDDYGEHIGWEYRGYDDDERFLVLWEVVHVRHNGELGDRYGRSIFASGLRPTGFALQGMRDSTTIQAVKNAAGQVAMIFGVPSTMPQPDRMLRLEEMYELTARSPVMDSDGKLDRRVIESMSDQPLCLFYDVFPDGKGAKPEIQQLNATNLGSMVEVLEHFQDLFLVPLKVPKSQMGIERSGEGLGGNRLSTQTVEFAKYLNSEQQDMVDFVLRIIALAYWLVDRPLKAGMITVIMPDLSVLDTKIRAEIRKLAMETAEIATRIPSLTPAYIWTELLWDGDSKTADLMAEKYGVDLEAEEPEPDPVQGEPEPPDPDDVNEARRLIGRHLSSEMAQIKQVVLALGRVQGSNK